MPSGMRSEAPSDRLPDLPAALPELADCLSARCDIWVFGYGSLMWDPGFRHCEAEPGLLRGWHRSFCVYSHRHRGTPEKPGLVLGLDRGGSCRGTAFRIARRDVEEAMHYLWDRELRGGAYRMRGVPVGLADGRTVLTRAFVVDRRHRQYAGGLSVEETARLILQGVGGRGPCRAYLENTVRQLERLGLVDGPLHKLELLVKTLAASVQPRALAP